MTESLYVYVDSRSIHEYRKALSKEIFAWQSSRVLKKPIKTVFIGVSPVGLYPYELVLDTAGILRSTFEFDPQAEITLEIYPGTSIVDVTHVGITRLSINTSQGQYTVADLAKTLDAIPAGLCVSVDVIAGPDNQEHWKEFIMQVALLPLHHISITYESGFALYRWTVQALADRGFAQYEMMNFARGGHESKHSLAYWQRKPYKGFGVGANSFERDMRTRNTSDLEQYLSGDTPVVFQETISREQELVELLLLGLRQTAGITWKMVEPHGIGAQDLQDLVEGGYVRTTQEGFALTHEGFGVMDDIIVGLAYKGNTNIV